MSDDRDTFYKKLKTTLEETSEFPSKYLYKFIIPNDLEKTKQLQKIFNFGGAVINTKLSSTKKFLSFSVLIEMPSADLIIEKYKMAGKIEGIISL